MENLFQDLRFALRVLRKSPATTAVAILTLAVAIGATTSIFTAVNAMLLRPLPFRDPDRLVEIRDQQPAMGGTNLSFPEITDLRNAQVPFFTGLAGYRDEFVNLTGTPEPERITALLVGEGLFGLLGAPPILGRDFAAAEHARNGPPAVIAAPAFWERRLGSASIGSTVQLDGTPFTLVGVASPALDALRKADVYVPLERKPPHETRGTHFLDAVARLAPSVTLATAQHELPPIAHRLSAVVMEEHGATVVGLREFLRGSAGPLLLLLLAAVSLVLLIAAVNLANVTLARSAGRAREFAVRRALGAGSGRLARQLIVESAITGLAGGGLGVLLAMWGKDLMLHAWPATLPRLGEAPLDLRVLAFAALVSLISGVGIGLLPALAAGRGDLSLTLKEGAGATARGKARAVLVVAQSALAVLLLIGAGLVLQSLGRMLHTDPGFRSDRALTLRVGLPVSKYPGPVERNRFFSDLLGRIGALPGVRAAGAARLLPLSGGHSNGDFSIVGRPALAEKDMPNAEKRLVTPGYFAAMGIPLERGRLFTDADRQGGPQVVLISKRTARDVFPGEDPLGQRLDAGFFHDKDTSAEIVGVVADVKQDNLTKPATNEIYFPYAQIPGSELTLVVRTEGEPAAMIGAVKAQIAALDPEQPVARIRTLEQLVEDSAAPQRLTATLLGAFALAALLLAALGIYGVVSYGVSRRQREIGVRIALGARAADVVRMILREGLKLSLAGVLCGVVAALLLGKLMAAFLFGVSASDPITYAAVAGSIAFVACLASLLPARRAARVDPAVALKAE